MSETRISKKLVAVGVAGLLVSAYFQIDQNAEDSKRNAAKVTLQVTSDGTTANMAYGIAAVPGPRKPITLTRDDTIDTNSWRDTVIVPKGKKVFLIVERTDKNALCWIIYQGRVESTNSTMATGQAVCSFTPR